MESIRLVLLGRCIASPLLRDHVDHDRTREVARATQGMLDLDGVMPIDGADVLQAEVFEHPLRGDDVLQALLHAVKSLVDGCADDGRALQRASPPSQESLIPLGRAQRREVMRHAPDGR